MNKLLAFFLLLLASAAADAQTAVQWGNNSGTVCAYDTSAARPCVTVGTLNPATHTFTLTAPATLSAPTSIPTTATVGTGTVAASEGALINGHCVSINSMGQFVDGGSACVQFSSAGSNQFATGVNTSGAVTYAQPSFTNLSGSVAASQMPALTGDVTTPAGAVATTIAANAVTNAKAAQMAASTIKGNNTGSTANAADLTVSQVNAILEPQWTAYTPTAIAGTGAFTSVSATGRYQQVGKRVTVSFTITITTNGTAAGFISLSLPVQSYSSGVSSGSCRENAVSGLSGNVTVTAGSSVALIYRYDNSYMGGTGYSISGSVTYESM